MKVSNGIKFAIVATLIPLLAVASVLGACAKPAPAPVPATPAPSPAPAPKPSPAPSPKVQFPKTIAVATSTSGASGHVMSVALSKFAEEEIGVKVMVAEHGSTVARVKMVINKDTEFGNTLGFTVVKDAWDGKEAFTGRQPIRVVMSEYLGGMLLISLKRAGIVSTKDLKGKRIMVINKGLPYYEEMLRYLLEYNGMTWNDIKGIEYADPREVNDGLKAGTIDGGYRTSGAKGSGAVIELSRTLDINVLSHTEGEIKHVLSKQPSFQKLTTAAGVYKGVGELQLLGYPMYTIARQDVSDDLVYAVCKIMMDTCGPDTPGRFEKVHPDRDYTLRSACPVPSVAPYHNGAVKYYKDRGVWTDEHERAQKKLLG